MYIVIGVKTFYLVQATGFVDTNKGFYIWSYWCILFSLSSPHHKINRPRLLLLSISNHFTAGHGNLQTLERYVHQIERKEGELWRYSVFCPLFFPEGREEERVAVNVARGLSGLCTLRSHFPSRSAKCAHQLLLGSSP